MVATNQQKLESRDLRLPKFHGLMRLTHLSDSQMPFHGLSHPETIWENAQRLAARCEECGIHVDLGALSQAIPLHDALLHIDPRLLGFRSSEAMAATMIYNFAVLQGLPLYQAKKLEGIVAATDPLNRPRTVEETIMRAADLWNVGSSYQEFSRNALRLHRETEIRRDEAVAPDTWTANSFGYLRLFLWPMLELTPHARDSAGRSVWHRSAMGNMTRFWSEFAATNGRVVAELIDPKIGLSLPTAEVPYFYIGVHGDEGYREQLVHETPMPLPNKSVACVIPGSAKGISVPDNICDELITSDLSPTSVQEASRVLKPGGVLSVRISDGGNARSGIAPTPPGFVFMALSGDKLKANFAKNEDSSKSG